MKRRHQIGELTRRRALALAGGFGMASLAPAVARVHAQLHDNLRSARLPAEG
jgi:hypothetical protein